MVSIDSAECHCVIHVTDCHSVRLSYRYDRMSWNHNCVERSYEIMTARSDELSECVKTLTRYEIM